MCNILGGVRLAESQLFTNVCIHVAAKYVSSLFKSSIFNSKWKVFYQKELLFQNCVVNKVCVDFSFLDKPLNLNTIS